MRDSEDGLDVAVIGGGLVGLSTAVALSERLPERRITVFEKEPDIAQHQSGRNSGVIHSGVYYTPGSLKARLCTEGRRRLESFCREHNVAWDRCGKVIVATDRAELPRLEAIAERGRSNGVSCTLIDPNELRDLEPYARGVRALHVPDPSARATWKPPTWQPFRPTQEQPTSLLRDRQR